MAQAGALGEQTEAGRVGEEVGRRLGVLPRGGYAPGEGDRHAHTKEAAVVPRGPTGSGCLR